MKKLYHVLCSIMTYAHTKYTYWSHTKYIKKLMSSCDYLKELTSEQKGQIQDYYKLHYGKRLPDYYWHQYYYTQHGIFSPKYVPNYIVEEINGKLFNKHITTTFDDKNLYYTIFPDVRQPRAYLNCINGYYYINGRPITKDDAIESLFNLGKAVIKPTFCSQNGNNVKYIELIDGVDSRSGQTLSVLFEQYGKNFVIQEAIRQHPALSALCPSSVNTMRVVTYRRGNDIVLIYAVMRMGKVGSEVDNTSAGGMACKILTNGRLNAFATCPKPAARFDHSETGVVFDGYEIPYFGDVFEQAKKMHLRLPYFVMVGWDFTINDQNEVVFIEMNTPFGLHQPAAGPGYGEYTDEIFDLCFCKKILK